MDASAAGATPRGVSIAMSSPSSRKEWRAVSDHHQPRSAAEEGREPGDMDFCSITIHGSLDHDSLQQQLHTIATQREELQQVEIELRAQVIVRSEIMEMQNSFDAQLNEHANAASRLQEQLHERERAIHELERRMEEKDRELHATRLDNEAAWAKEDLLRKHNKELATFRREQDQLHELQEHFQEKERQLGELQEQHRVVQETILFKDDQLKEAQAWITRVQEMDGLQSNTLQAELRDRTEHYNHILLVWQRQFAEMERHYVHTIQQLQLELANEREKSGTYTEESRIAQMNSKDASLFGQNNGNQLYADGDVTSSGASEVLLKKNSDSAPSHASNGNPLIQSELAPSSLLGVSAYLPPGQVPALQPFVIHQQGVPNSVPLHVPHPHVAQIQSVPTITSHQQWQSQQIVPEDSQPSAQNQFPLTSTDQNLMRSDAKYDYDGQALHSDSLDANFSQGMAPDSVTPSSSGESQVSDSIDRSYPVAPQSEQSLQQNSSELQDALRFDSRDQEQRNPVVADHGPEGRNLIVEQSKFAMNTSLPDMFSYTVSHGETTAKKTSVETFPESHVLTVQTNPLTHITLLDERSLLACVVRTIPAGGRIRISSTLPNRLGKMLAPLHWHDYRKRHGKLEDFLASHPDLFLIESDHIQLREGAQEMIAATAAVAKVAAAAAAASTPHSILPSIAVTPMAHSHRVNKFPSIDSKPVKTDTTHLSGLQAQHSNGVSFGSHGGTSNLKTLGKSKDHSLQNGTEDRTGQLTKVANGANLDRSGFNNTQIRGLTNGRPNANFAGKQLGRTTGAAPTSRR